jgi:hypothetical protein
VPYRELIGLSGFAIAIPLLLGWCKLRLWDWQASR